MANGDSGTKGGKTAAKINMEDWERKFFLNHDLSGGLTEPFFDYMKQRGFTKEEAQEVRNLLNAHGGTSHQQGIADQKIVDELEAGTRLGQALEAKIDFEETLYKEWIKHQAASENPWEHLVYDGEKRIFRKGNRKDGVEAWTVLEEGANMGWGGIGYDHASTVETMFKEGYRILGGVGMMTGSPGEGEITFVKYKKHKK